MVPGAKCAPIRRWNSALILIYITYIVGHLHWICKLFCKPLLKCYAIKAHIKTYTLIGIDNLPHKVNDVLLVVDKEVAIQAWRDLRDDVVYMHCPLVKDDKHNSLASFSLVKWKNSYVRMNCT